VPPGLGTVTDVNVAIDWFTHSSVLDVNLLLVGPRGQTCLLMSRVMGGADKVHLTFDDGGVPMGGNWPGSGTYRPTANGPGYFSTPAPPGPYGTELSVFNGTDPTGTWRLFVLDDIAGPTRADGRIERGWRLKITTTTETDYDGTWGTVTIPAGSTSASVDVTVKGDRAIEIPETFAVELSDAAGATLADATGIGTIANDDDFTDPVLSGMFIKTIHLTELRDMINAARLARGLSRYAFSATPMPHVTPIRAADIQQLRAALPAGCAPASYTDPAIIPGVTKVKAAHVAEIRASVLACQ
jgi:subtilisin-like proprotein convertase family protein